MSPLTTAADNAVGVETPALVVIEAENAVVNVVSDESVAFTVTFA
jgi:hypothetical protein